MHTLKRFRVAIITLALIVTPSITAAETPKSSREPSAMSSKKAETTAKKAARLEDAKLKVCQNKEQSITKRSTQLTKMATNMVSTFDKIATRVQTYYTDTIVPSGKTVSNYDTLVAEITTKKAAVQVALTAAQTAATSFSCTSDDPKGQLTEFRTTMQSVKSALKDYRTSIKNLIVAVRGVAGTSSPKASTSPKASASPSTTQSASPTSEVE